MTVHVFGVRHHGPGSARSLCAALDELAPDIVLIEGPPDAEAVLPLVGPEMKPPVALLVYASDAPSRAAFYPFAAFSPEWQAIDFAHRQKIPVRFIDLPQAHQLLPPPVPEAPTDSESEAATESETATESEADSDLQDDPIGMLAEAAGYEDRELWWEQQIEQRRDPRGVFDGVLTAMTELRNARRSPPDSPRTERENRREAFMRKSIRAAQKEGFARIAVVCGAWHAPVLVESELAPRAKTDDACLKGLPKVKVEATWIPWTYSRLSYRSGYGAGVSAPGWYAHLWEAQDKAPLRWLVLTAQLLREAGIDASSASVIEAVRLADTLAALRGLSMPGLPELGQATEAVLCRGESAQRSLIRDRLEVGELLGEVPDEAPAVPLQRDLAATQKKLRMKPSAEIKTLDLDLRSEGDRARSELLHRLSLLGVPWGTHSEARGQKQGTFHENWTLVWKPELAVSLIEASLHGNTIVTAATSKIARDAASADLPTLTALLDAAMLAALPEAIDQVLGFLQAQSAISADVRLLLHAFPPLVRTTRYGSVREVRTKDVMVVVDGLFERILIGVGPACASLDDGAASEMSAGLSGIQESLKLLENPEKQAEWTRLLQSLIERDAVHGLVRGNVCRSLVDGGSMTQEDLERHARLALSTANPPPQAAAWLEGLLRGSALLLLHHEGVWSALDHWLAALAEDTFVEMLPLVRRAFANFGSPERRQMAEKAKALRGSPSGKPAKKNAGTALDVDRAALVLPVLSQILGVELR